MCFLICTWPELDRPKGYCEIASAVYHRLKNTVFPPDKETVRLVADGCGGQNKNSMLILMAKKWLSDAPRNIKKVELIFLVTAGHSYLPPDRVFGQVEKFVCKKTIIIQSAEYYEAFGSQATVIKLCDVEVLDWKSERTTCFKTLQNWHFQISK